MKIALLLIMFFCIAGLMIVYNNGLPLYGQENRATFFSLYGKWMNDIFSNAINITGKAVDLEWLPKE